jgi:hypothetical protein
MKRASDYNAARRSIARILEQADVNRGNDRGAFPKLRRTSECVQSSWQSLGGLVYTSAICSVLMAVALLGQQPAPSSAGPSLDYEVFKARIQPIFLAKRPGHARCIACHTEASNFRMQPLLPGNTTWTEEQSRKNFEAVRRVAFPGNPRSRILLHPLAEDAGGDFFHNGGKHFSSQNDREWQTLKSWVLGENAKSGG